MTCAICTGTPFQSTGFDHDLRTLRLQNSYAIDEGSDLFQKEDRFYIIRTCKDCRGDFLTLLWAWAKGAALPVRANVNPDANIPVRMAGRTVMLTREQWEEMRGESRWE